MFAKWVTCCVHSDLMTVVPNMWSMHCNYVCVLMTYDTFLRIYINVSSITITEKQIFIEHVLQFISAKHNTFLQINHYASSVTFC